MVVVGGPVGEGGVGRAGKVGDAGRSVRGSAGLVLENRGNCLRIVSVLFYQFLHCRDFCAII